MRSTRLFLSFVLFASLAIVACSDDGGSTRPPDAMPDAMPDAPAALMGLGQRCDMGTPATCPANAPLCLRNAMGRGFCTKQCVMNSMFTTNAQNQPGPLNPDPATGDAMCPPIYTGAIGTAICGIPYNRMPPGALAPNTTYTLQWGCAITCGAGNTCPMGLQCDMAVMTCLPLM